MRGRLGVRGRLSAGGSLALRGSLIFSLLFIRYRLFTGLLAIRGFFLFVAALFLAELLLSFVG